MSSNDAAALRAEIERALARSLDWRLYANGADRDAAYERRELLRRLVKMLNDGKLCLAPQEGEQHV